MAIVPAAVPRWQQAHDVVVKSRVGSTIKFEKFGEAMDLDLKNTKHKVILYSAVNRAKGELAKKGYAIEAVPKVGYRVMAGPARVKGRRTIIEATATKPAKKVALEATAKAAPESVKPRRKATVKASGETEPPRPKPTPKVAPPPPPVPVRPEFVEPGGDEVLMPVAEDKLSLEGRVVELGKQYMKLTLRFEELQAAHVQQTQELTDATKLIQEVLDGMKEFRVTVVSPWHEGVGRHRPQD